LNRVSPDIPLEGVMKSLVVAAALAAALIPNCVLAQGPDDCWGPAQLSASAPDAESRDSITLLSDEDTTALLTAATNHNQHPAAGIVAIYSARYSRNPAKVLIFAFNEKNCLIDRGAIPIDEWRNLFGPVI
jgi:hypothetical protein